MMNISMGRSLYQNKQKTNYFFKRRNRNGSKAKKGNIKLKVHRVVSDGPNIMEHGTFHCIPESRIMSPQPRVDLNQLDTMMQKLDTKVMMARKSRYGGLASPFVLKHKSRQFQSIDIDHSCMS